MLDAVDLIENLAGSDTTLVPGHGTLVRKNDLLAYRAILVDILAKVKTMRDKGKSLKEVLAANLTAPYDKTTQGDTQQSKDRFITEVYDEVKDFPPVVDGKRTMPKHPYRSRTTNYTSDSKTPPRRRRWGISPQRKSRLEPTVTRVVFRRK